MAEYDWVVGWKNGTRIEGYQSLEGSLYQLESSNVARYDSVHAAEQAIGPKFSDWTPFIERTRALTNREVFLRALQLMVDDSGRSRRLTLAEKLADLYVQEADKNPPAPTLANHTRKGWAIVRSGTDYLCETTNKYFADDDTSDVMLWDTEIQARAKLRELYVNDIGKYADCDVKCVESQIVLRVGKP